MNDGSSLQGKKKLSLRPGTAIAGALLLLGAGVFAGVMLRGNAVPAATPSAAGTPSAASTSSAASPVNVPGSGAAVGAMVIDMTKATGESCRGPVSPGRGHPDRLLSQVFSVRDGRQNAYLLGWQIVPYRGARTYSLGTAGNLLALEPPTGGAPLGFGSGTVTISGKTDTGTVHARVRLTAGGTLSVTGSWVCSTTPRK
jgi:hypothetical protein